MSTYRAKCPTVDGFDGLSDVEREESWPFDWATSITSDFGPISLTRARAIEWFWRLRKLSMSFEMDESDGVTPQTWDFGTFDLVRRVTEAGASMSDESELRAPGISETFGQTSTDGPFHYFGDSTLEPSPGDSVTATFQVSIFFKEAMFSELNRVNVPHMAYDALSGLWKPSVRITGSVIVNTGSEYTHTFESYSDPDTILVPDGSFNADFLSGIGGDDLPVQVYSDAGGGPTFTGASMTLNPASSDGFWSWGGKWNTSTGARN